jgi:muramoyltetrapeptide carboxypeptidase
MKRRADSPVRPPRLGPGARVALISPAGPSAEEKVDAALRRCERMGFEGVLGEAARERHGYLAGQDAARAADFKRAVSEPSIDAIWALRGGYGTMRLLRSVDLRPLRERPKAFIGFSDNTALHLAFAHAGLVSFHGPHAGAEESSFSESCLRRIVFDAEAGALPVPANGSPVVTVCGGSAEGALAGGNLIMLAAACGTDHALQARGRLLVLEEVGEATYRIDRAITQLHLAGCLDGVAGVVLGQFTERPAHEGEQPFEDVMRDLFAPFRVPVVLGVPVGHIADQWTLPLGVRARLDADRGTLTLLEAGVT